MRGGRVTEIKKQKEQLGKDSPLKIDELTGTFIILVHKMIQSLSLILFGQQTCISNHAYFMLENCLCIEMFGRQYVTT